MEQTLDIVNKNNLFFITKNNEHLKTPLGNIFYVYKRKIARLILQELDENSSKNLIVGYTKITNSAIDLIDNDKEGYTENISSYIHKDTICYFSSKPKDLFDKQNKTWKPLINWIKKKYRLDVNYTQNIGQIKQNQKCLKMLKNELIKYNIFQLSCINTLCQVTGSLIISLALKDCKLSYLEAFKASQLEELYQLSKWGDDSEASSRRKAIRTDIFKASIYLNSLKDG